MKLIGHAPGVGAGAGQRKRLVYRIERAVAVNGGRPDISRDPRARYGIGGRGANQCGRDDRRECQRDDGTSQIDTIYSTAVYEGHDARAARNSVA